MHTAGFESPPPIIPGNKTFGQRVGAAAFWDSNLEIGKLRELVVFGFQNFLHRVIKGIESTVTRSRRLVDLFTHPYTHTGSGFDIDGIQDYIQINLD